MFVKVVVVVVVMFVIGAVEVVNTVVILMPFVVLVVLILVACSHRLRCCSVCMCRKQLSSIYNVGRVIRSIPAKL